MKNFNARLEDNFFKNTFGIEKRRHMLDFMKQILREERQHLPKRRVREGVP